jgi:uncharacterized protein
MKINVKAKAGAREQKVEKVDDANFVVWVKEPPVDGKANFAITRALAEYFGVSSYNVRLISGSSSKQKVFEIL